MHDNHETNLYAGHLSIVKMSHRIVIEEFIEHLHCSERILSLSKSNDIEK